MNKKSKNSDTVGSWIGVGTALGAAVFAATNEPVWMAVGVAIGAAMSWRKPKNEKERRKMQRLRNLILRESGNSTKN